MSLTLCAGASRFGASSILSFYRVSFYDRIWNVLRFNFMDLRRIFFSEFRLEFEPLEVERSERASTSSMKGGSGHGCAEPKKHVIPRS